MMRLPTEETGPAVVLESLFATNSFLVRWKNR